MKPYSAAYHKLWKFNPALASETIYAKYASTGRTVRDPALLIHSFLLMIHMVYLFIDNWCKPLRSDSLLQHLTGSFDLPCAASHYDFINRFTRTDPHLFELQPFFHQSTVVPSMDMLFIDQEKLQVMMP